MRNNYNNKNKKRNFTTQEEKSQLKKKMALTFFYPQVQAAGAWQGRSRRGFLDLRFCARRPRCPGWKLKTVGRIPARRRAAAATVHLTFAPPWHPVRTFLKSCESSLLGAQLTLRKCKEGLRGVHFSLGIAPPSTTLTRTRAHNNPLIPRNLESPDFK